MVQRRYLLLETAESSRTPLEGDTEDFLLRCLLGARREASFPSNEGGFDEDVNVYLVGLLGRFFSPGYHEEARLYVHSFDLDLRRCAEESGDPRQIYRLYKVNADHLLLAIGLFQSVEGLRQDARPYLERTPRELESRGGLYYQIASSRLRHLKRGGSGTETALSKLGDGFPRYAEVLRYLRSSYFQLTRRLGEGTLYHLARATEETDSPATSTQELYDLFLDRYSEWRKNSDREHREALAQAARRLREADASFHFEIPGEEEPQA
ncbi:MAG TPA: hypothetical protein VKA63_07905 [Candidatus Krumholzibacteria bacterium]|nr:hypothetical protein [Candidatus Krumholzibacteria bacterium]